MVRALVMDREDNVATLIDAGKAGDRCHLKGPGGGEIILRADIPYGHKIAIKPIAEGGTVMKHGQDIGVTNASIGVGEHAHVHNVESRRGRGDKHKLQSAQARKS
ncbi:MAG TPA: UxaA family hydrolase [Lacipirellulaceae bacterium]|nr:UxaA family hydrolase [Lacipirellulaceae bacterium]